MEKISCIVGSVMMVFGGLSAFAAGGSSGSFSYERYEVPNIGGEGYRRIAESVGMSDETVGEEDEGSSELSSSSDHFTAEQREGLMGALRRLRAHVLGVAGGGDFNQNDPVEDGVFSFLNGIPGVDLSTNLIRNYGDLFIFLLYGQDAPVPFIVFDINVRLNILEQVSNPDSKREAEEQPVKRERSEDDEGGPSAPPAKRICESEASHFTAEETVSIAAALDTDVGYNIPVEIVVAVTGDDAMRAILVNRFPTLIAGRAAGVLAALMVPPVFIANNTILLQAQGAEDLDDLVDAVLTQVYEVDFTALRARLGGSLTWINIWEAIYRGRPGFGLDTGAVAFLVESLEEAVREHRGEGIAFYKNAFYSKWLALLGFDSWLNEYDFEGPYGSFLKNMYHNALDSLRVRCRNLTHSQLNYRGAFLFVLADSVLEDCAEGLQLVTIVRRAELLMEEDPLFPGLQYGMRVVPILQAYLELRYPSLGEQALAYGRRLAESQFPYGGSFASLLRKNREHFPNSQGPEGLLD